MVSAQERRRQQFERDASVRFAVEDVPSLAELLGAQSQARDTDGVVEGDLTQRTDDAWVTADGAIWVPDRLHLRLRIIIAAHGGAAGHRGSQTTLQHVSKRFWWPGMGEDVISFCTHCLHCVRVRGGEMVPRPLGHVMHASGVNEVIHMDYMYIGEPPESAGHRFTHVLVLVDGFSRFVRFIPCENADSFNVVQALLGWFADYRVVRQWVSDGGSHFVNSIVDELCHKMRAQHHITTAYAAWTNGLVERMNKTLLDAMRPILSDGRLDEHDWPWVLPVVQRLVNQSPSTALGGLAPCQVFNGTPPDSPLDVMFLPSASGFTTVRVSGAEVQQATQRLCSALEEYALIVEAVEPRSRRPRPGEQAVNFGTGDFVLLSSRASSTRRLKLQPGWLGPFEVVRTISDVEFEIRDLVTNQLRRVHAQHLRLYSDSQLEVSEQLLSHVAHAGRGDVIESIVDHYIDELQQVLLVHWEHQPDSARSWEPLSRIYKDAPAAVNKYVRRVMDVATRQQLQEYMRKARA